MRSGRMRTVCVALLVAVCALCVVAIPADNVQAQCVNGQCLQAAPAYIGPAVYHAPIHQDVFTHTSGTAESPPVIASPAHVFPVCHGSHCQPHYPPPFTPFRYKRTFGITFHSGRVLSPWMRR